LGETINLPTYWEKKHNVLVKSKTNKGTDVNIEILVNWKNIYVFHETNDQCVLYLNQDNINV